MLSVFTNVIAVAVALNNVEPRTVICDPVVANIMSVGALAVVYVNTVGLLGVPTTNGLLNVTTNPDGVVWKLVTINPRVTIAGVLPTMLAVVLSVAVNN
jgi:hypothetical protein